MPRSKKDPCERQKNQWPVVVITSQSGIARGLFDWNDYESVTQPLLHLLGHETLISAIYANGYGHDSPINSWRKQSPGMLLAAANDLNIDLSRSILVGDRLSDIQARASGGLPLLIHVITGHGKEERASVEAWGSKCQHIKKLPL